jgi:hypothetical protein
LIAVSRDPIYRGVPDCTKTVFDSISKIGQTANPPETYVFVKLNSLLITISTTRNEVFSV